MRRSYPKSVNLRVKAHQIPWWKAAAASQNMTFSEFIRWAVDSAARDRLATDNEARR